MNAIEVRDIAKRYRLEKERHLLLRNFLLNPFRRRRTRVWLWALKGVSFDVPAGETLGIVGPNGAGKSTLLKIIAGVTAQTRGELKINGRVASLLELVAGFRMDLTGRENIYLNGKILGQRTREINRKYESIVEFSELEEFIDAPLRTYSSGMAVRLGFSIATAFEPEILLIDEVFSVGDARFQDKCVSRLSEFIRQGVTIIFVSHDRQTMERICSRAIFLMDGELKGDGPTLDVFEQYYKILKQIAPEKRPKGLKGFHAAPEKAEIVSVDVRDKQGRHTAIFRTGEAMIVEIRVLAKEPLDDVLLFCRINQMKGMVLHETSPQRSGKKVRLEAGMETTWTLRYDELNLLEGHYYLTVGLQKSWDSPVIYDVHERAFEFAVASNISHGAGVSYLPHRWIEE